MMTFSWKRELSLTFQYLLFSLCAATVTLAAWDEMWYDRLFRPGDIIGCESTSEWVKNVVRHYYPRHILIFLALGAFRISLAYLSRGRAKELS